jgi:hypothetical protein
MGATCLVNVTWDGLVAIDCCAWAVAHTTKMPIALANPTDAALLERSIRGLIVALIVAPPKCPKTAVP